MSESGLYIVHGRRAGAFFRYLLFIAVIFTRLSQRLHLSALLLGMGRTEAAERIHHGEN